MLNIRETYCQQGKISNNLENHGEEEVTAFDIPITGVLLTGEEINALLEDPYADRWLFDSKKDLRVPNVAKFHPLVMLDTFDEAHVSLTMSSGALHTFAKSKISKVTLEALRGGEVSLGFTLRIRPENDQQILDLIEHQHRQIKIDITDAKVQLKGGRNQQELPLNSAGEGEEPENDGKDEELTHPEQLFEKPKSKRGRGKNADTH